MSMWKVMVDISPRTIDGTKGCHIYVFGEYKTKKEAKRIVNEINEMRTLGKAYFKKE